VQREREMARLPLARDFGRLLKLWSDEIEEVRAVSPDSAYLGKLAAEQATLKRESDEVYPKAIETFRGGVYETAFLETFVSNYPSAPEFAEVSLALGDAYSRLGRSTEAVESYLKAWHTAAQELADQAEDAELRGLAGSRLESAVGVFTDLASGAAYLRRFPANAHADRVSHRLDSLADNLYGEMVLYQSVGDHAKALDRIQQILNHAPGSPAARRLRDKATVVDDKTQADG
jgi:tetratricopeptide (TPR) repeat protein